MEKVNVAQKFGQFDDFWSPKIVGELNGQYVKLARLKGDFIWHSHADEDEMFLVIQGAFTMKFRDREVRVSAGEFLIVPRGVEHCPEAQNECLLMLFEPAETKHTGAEVSERTVNDQPWI